MANISWEVENWTDEKKEEMKIIKDKMHIYHFAF